MNKYISLFVHWHYSIKDKAGQSTMGLISVLELFALDSCLLQIFQLKVNSMKSKTQRSYYLNFIEYVHSFRERTTQSETSKFCEVNFYQNVLRGQVVFIDRFVMPFIFLFIGLSFNTLENIVLHLKCRQYNLQSMFVLLERERQKINLKNLIINYVFKNSTQF